MQYPPDDRPVRAGALLVVPADAAVAIGAVAVMPAFTVVSLAIGTRR